LAIEVSADKARVSYKDKAVKVDVPHKRGAVETSRVNYSRLKCARVSLRLHAAEKPTWSPLADGSITELAKQYLCNDHIPQIKRGLPHPNLLELASELILSQVSETPPFGRHGGSMTGVLRA
jgi:hypothetical protein